jgi:hypothetical protein
VRNIISASEDLILHSCFGRGVFGAPICIESFIIWTSTTVILWCLPYFGFAENSENLREWHKTESRLLLLMQKAHSFLIQNAKELDASRIRRIPVNQRQARCMRRRRSERGQRTIP